jgi:hypothetical protein
MAVHASGNLLMPSLGKWSSCFAFDSRKYLAFAVRQRVNNS